MRTLAGFVIVTSTLLSGQAVAGGFDGNWIGQIPPSGRCNSVSTMTITVSGDTLSGVIHNVANVRSFTGKIDTQGEAAFTISPTNHSGTIKFTNDHFDANWDSGDCIRHSLGDRAPDAAQTAALIAQRKQAQAVYDDLTAKAVAGDQSVDFTALRSAYPFTEQWDAFGKTTGPLMEQASAAAKGKDCSSALQKLDEVLRIDYTVIAAHRVRSDCLKGHAAHLEAKIADALMDSLKHGGNGKSEQTAYPVVTLREEREILDEKQIVLKTRDVEVRGSNGRYYDVVHGIYLRATVGVQDVYFDVTPQVNGRNSRIVATDLVAATLP